MLAIALLGLVHLVCGAVAALYLWRARRPADLGITALLHAFLTFYGLPIAIGWISGYINTITILASALLACINACMAWWKGRESSLDCGQFRCLARTFSRWEIALFSSIGLYLAMTWFLGANLPIRSWDAVGYHSLNPMAWAVDGRFELHAFGDSHLEYYVTHAETFPNAKAVLPFLVLWWTGYEEGTALAQWPFLLIVIAAAYAVFRRMNLPRWSALIGTHFILAAPEVFLQSLDAYADLQFLAGQIALVWILVVLAQEKFAWREMILAGSAFAILAGAKPNALMMAGVIGLFYLVVLFLRGKNIKLARRILLCCLAMIVAVTICLLVSGPWYVHAWSKFGNPVFPISITIGERIIFSGVTKSTVANVMLTGHTGASGLRGWWMMMNESHRDPSIASWAGGLGAHTLILGLPALLMFGLNLFFEEKRRPIIYFLSIFVVIFLASPVHNWPRMVMFELILYGFAFAWCVWNSKTIFRSMLLISFLLLLLFNAARCLPAYLYRTRIPEIALYPLITGSSRPAFHDDIPGSYTVKDYWRETVARPGDLLAIPAKTESVWSLRPLVRGASVVRVAPFQKHSGLRNWTQELRDSGATHFYAPADTPDFAAAMSMPETFRLLLWRYDSSAEAPWNILPQPEASLFEIIGSGRGER